MVVVDELHMIGSGPRGALLEIVLGKIKAVPQQIKIIGMSATINNIDEVAKVCLRMPLMDWDASKSMHSCGVDSFSRQMSIKTTSDPYP